jgi:hypothetical protein
MTLIVERKFSDAAAWPIWTGNLRIVSLVGKIKPIHGQAVDFLSKKFYTHCSVLSGSRTD